MTRTGKEKKVGHIWCNGEYGEAFGVVGRILMMGRSQEMQLMKRGGLIHLVIWLVRRRSRCGQIYSVQYTRRRFRFDQVVGYSDVFDGIWSCGCLEG